MAGDAAVECERQDCHRTQIYTADGCDVGDFRRCRRPARVAVYMDYEKDPMENFSGNLLHRDVFFDSFHGIGDRI